MTLAADGAAFLNETMKDSAGVTIRYTPKGWGVPAETLTAWTGTAGLDETATPSGGTTSARLTTRERDYLITLADLVTQTPAGRLPVEGDRITETIGGTACTFEVCKRGAEPCWRFSDRERTRVRVHTKPTSAV